jgi:hypothetical protein
MCLEDVYGADPFVARREADKRKNNSLPRSSTVGECHPNSLTGQAGSG